MNKICGFMVVRKPKMNFDKEGRGAFLSHAPNIDGLYYGGVDRMPWFEIDEDYFSGILPKQLIELRKELRKTNQDTSDLKLLFDLSLVNSVIEYSNKKIEINEIIVLRSSGLERTKGSFICDNEIEWHGIDIHCQGYGSLLREGIFSKPEVFSTFINAINEHGLFNEDSKLINYYIEHYINISKAHNLEKIDRNIAALDRIEVGNLMNY